MLDANELNLSDSNDFNESANLLTDCAIIVMFFIAVVVPVALNCTDKVSSVADIFISYYRVYVTEDVIKVCYELSALQSNVSVFLVVHI